MAIDLIISKSGNVMLASNNPFPAAVSRVEYFTDTRQLRLMFETPETDGLMMDVEVHETLISAVRDSTTVFVVYMKNSKPHDGYEVPLVQIGL